MRYLKPAAITLLSGGLLACSLALSADREQCATTADCQRFAANAICVSGICQAPVADEAGSADSGPVDPAWGCLGKVPTLLEAKTEPVEIQYTFLAFGGNPIASFPLKLCRSQDTACLNPVGVYPTDDKGTATLPIYNGFRGYLQSEPSETYSTLLPFRSYVPIVNPAIPASSARTYLTVFSAFEVGQISSQLRTEANPALGHVIFTARDCKNDLATEVTASTDSTTDESITFYLDSNGSPSREQQKTSVPGVGGIFNLTPGVVALKYERNGQYVGAQNIVIGAGSITYLNAIPTP